jgi:hypothetical protein
VVVNLRSDGLPPQAVVWRFIDPDFQWDYLVDNQEGSSLVKHFSVVLDQLYK